MSFLSVVNSKSASVYSTAPSGFYCPFIQDTPSYGGDWATGPNGPGAYAGWGGLGTTTTSVGYVLGTGTTPNIVLNPNYPTINGPGLPFAYDPLWYFQAQLQGFNPNGLEARFGAGLGFIRSDPFDKHAPRHGLQRINNFSPTLPMWSVIPSVFVSPEDVVWQETDNSNYYIAPNAVTGPRALGSPPVTPPVGSAPARPSRT